MSPASSVEISAVMPAFNEEGNLEQSVGRMAAALADQARAFEVIVVDDGSQDGTAALLARLKAIHPSLRVVRHPVNRGYGAALRSGFAAARYPWVFLMDADNQFDPADVAVLLAAASVVAGGPDPSTWTQKAVSSFEAVTHAAQSSSSPASTPSPRANSQPPARTSPAEPQRESPEPSDESHAEPSVSPTRDPGTHDSAAPSPTPSPGSDDGGERGSPSPSPSASQP